MSQFHRNRLKEKKLNGVALNLPHYRDGTRIKGVRISLAYNNGGIGDYIQWTTAIRYAIETHRHISGLIIVPDFFADLAKLWLSNLAPRYRIHVTKNITEDPAIQNEPLRVPDESQSANACGWSLFQLGFIYYVGIDYIPESSRIPEIRGDETSVERFNLPESYAVITTEATVENRTLRAGVINQIARNLHGRGITPVFLGKSAMSENYISRASDGIDIRDVIDLREKTTLVEAAIILARAKLVLGLDNGLLHLACCSETPVIFAFTTVDPKHRIPPRKKGAKTFVITPPENLKCRFCQSNMKYLIGHHFSKCLYEDNLCCDLIKAESFIRVIDSLFGSE